MVLWAETLWSDTKPPASYWVAALWANMHGANNDTPWAMPTEWVRPIRDLIILNGP